MEQTGGKGEAVKGVLQNLNNSSVFVLMCSESQIFGKNSNRDAGFLEVPDVRIVI